MGDAFSTEDIIRLEINCYVFVSVYMYMFGCTWLYLVVFGFVWLFGTLYNSL